MQLVLRCHQPHLGGIKSRHIAAYSCAPAFEVGQVMRHELGECRAPLNRCPWIKYDLNQAQERVILDGEDRHVSSGHLTKPYFLFATGSASISSACKTRVCML